MAFNYLSSIQMVLLNLGVMCYTTLFKDLYRFYIIFKRRKKMKRVADKSICTVQ